MKKLLATTILAASMSVNAAQFDGVDAATVAYVSSYSDITLAINMDKGDTKAFAPYSDASLFCGVAGIDTGGLIAYGYDAVQFTAPTDDLYLVVCIKSSGLSGTALLAIGEPWFFGVSSRSYEQPDAEDMELLESAFEGILEK